MKIMFRLIFSAALASLTVLIAPPATAGGAGPNVVVSIKPIHSLVAGVMRGIGEPTLLIKGGGSPHSYSLRPSEAASLQNADVIFWIGDEMETFLEKPLEALPERARIVALHEANGVTLLPNREGDAWEKHVHEHEEGHVHDNDHSEEHGTSHDEEHAHGQENMHIWLDPSNAKAMVRQIVATLSEADPANAARYKASGADLENSLAQLDESLNRDLTPIKDRPYVVFHDAYQYFENRYDLSPAGSITVNPEHKPSARRVAEIRDKIKATGAVCVFSEPQFEPTLIVTVIEGTNAKSATLDPLGADLAPGPDAYFELMGGLGDSLRACLLSSS